MRSETKDRIGRLLLITGFVSATGGTLAAITILKEPVIGLLTLFLGFLSFIIGTELILLSNDTRKDIGPSPT